MFSVDPDRVDDWGAAVRNLVPDARLATSYAQTHLPLHGLRTGLFGAAADAVEHARAAMVDASTALDRLLSASAAELVRAADMYRSTDHAEAARLDAAYGGGAPLPAPVPVTGTPTAVLEDPAGALGTPVAVDPVPDIIEQIFRQTDWISPAVWAAWIIEQICGTDPVEFLAKEIGGDWEHLAVCADALHQLATFHARMAGAIGDGAADTVLGDEPAWAGVAATAAGGYFTGLAVAVAAVAGAAREMGLHCQAFAIAMHDAAIAIAGIITYLADLVIFAGLAAATGPPGAAAGVIVEGIRMWGVVLDIVSGLWTAANLLIAAVLGAVLPTRELAEHPLPGAAYDHLGV